jgi:tetratricopeptide (TPR) repeat protein
LALPIVQRALQEDAESPLLQQTQFRVLADLGDVDGIRRAGERWLRSAPSMEAAYRDYATALGRVGELAEAERVLRLGLERVRQREVLYSALADVYISQRRWPDVATQWLSMLEAAPAVGWDLIGFKLESLGRDATFAAEAVLDAVSTNSPSVPERELAAVAALYAGRPEEARDRSAAVLEDLDATRRQAFLDRFAKVAADQRQPGTVAWAFRRMLRDAPSIAVRWDLARRIVQHDLSAGDTSSALSTLHDALARAEPGTPPHRWASALQIRILAAQGEDRAAESAFRRHADLYPQDAELPLLALSVAEVNLRRGRLEEATAVLGAVPRIGTSTDVAARLAASRAYLALYAGRYDEARAEFDIAAALLKGEERGDALRFLSFLRDGNEAELRAVAGAHRGRSQGRHREAVEWLLDGLERAPSSAARPALLLWAGEWAVQVGAVERGEEALRWIPKFYPNSGEAPVALVSLAETLAGDGRAVEAMALLEKLILDYPESALTPLGRRRLAELREEVPRS